jgi:hypothetical protein
VPTIGAIADNNHELVAMTAVSHGTGREKKEENLSKLSG